MALNKNHAVPFRYQKGDAPTDEKRLPLHIHDELRKLELSVRRANALIPQAADAVPEELFIGMQRFTVSPWDPLGTGSGSWVYWNGSNWVAL